MALSHRSKRAAAVAFVAVLAGFLAGCADWVWVRPGTADQQVEQDREECRLQASSQARERYQSEGWRFGGDRRESEGYQRERTSWETERQNYEQRAVRRCMEERGYQLMERRPT